MPLLPIPAEPRSTWGVAQSGSSVNNTPVFLAVDVQGLAVNRAFYLTWLVSTPPTAAVLSAAGSTASVTVNHSTDTLVSLTLTPGGSGIAAGDQVQIAFGTAWTFPDSHGSLHGLYVDLTGPATDPQPYIVPSTDNAHLTVSFGVAPTSGVTYNFTVFVVAT